MRITHELSRFPGFPRPALAPAGDFGSGGGGDGLDDGGDGGGLDDLGDDGLDLGDDGLGLEDDGGDGFDDGAGDGGESDLDDGITDDIESIFGNLFTSPQGKPSSGGNQQQQQQQQEPTPQEVQTALAQQLNDGINALTIGEDAIPDDFNPNDPKSMRALLTNVQKATARAAVNLMFAPVQVALGRMTTELRREMAQAADSATYASTATRLLEQHVPAYQNPKLRPVVDMFFEQAKKRYPDNVRAQVAVTKRALAAVGVRSGSSTPRSRSQTGNRGGNGDEALNLFAPLGKPQANRQQGARRPSGNKPLNPAQKQLLARMISNLT